MTGVSVIGRIHAMVLNCPDPVALAAFQADPAGHPFCLVWGPDQGRPGQFYR